MVINAVILVIATTFIQSVRHESQHRGGVVGEDGPAGRVARRTCGPSVSSAASGTRRRA